jgi:hypothetical protein
MMSIFFSRLRVLAVPVLLGLGLAGFAATSGQAKTQDPTVCGVNATSNGSMMTLEAVFGSGADVTGSYQLNVNSSSGGGSSSVSQGGQFTAVANETTTVGQMSINDGSTYKVDFKVTIDGTEMDCSQVLPSRT